MNTPTTIRGDVLVTDAVDPDILLLLDEMTARDMPHGEMFSAILHGITPGVYMRARRLGLSHQEIIDDQTRIKTVYLHLRETYKVKDPEAIEVTNLTPDGANLYGKEKRQLYRVMIKAGRTHADGLKAIPLIDPCHKMGTSTAFPHRGLKGFEYRFASLCRFLAQAAQADPDSSPNDMWRAWLVHNNIEPSDIEEAA